MFNEKGALASQGSDVLYYWDDFPNLKQSLKEGDFSVLFNSTTQIHVRLYMMSYVVLYPLFGNSILSLEGMNLIFYLLIILLTYKIGEKCFDTRTGVLAAIIVGLWPSLLLHSSQPLRDTLFIALMLAYTILLYAFLDKGLSLLKAFTLVAGGLLLLALLWLIRDNITLLYLAMAGTCLGLLFLKVLKENKKKQFIYNFVCLPVLLIGILFIPKLLQNQLPEKREATPEQGQRLEEFTNQQNASNEFKFVKQIQFLRFKAGVLYPEAGSSIDADVQFSNVFDVIAYLPRALEIGIFSPFPNYWFSDGKIYGKTGRLLSGAEMFLTYLLYFFALIGIWQTRASPQMWLLLITFLSAAVSFGLVVINIGQLYRMRYFFWILAVILGSGGITFFLKKQKRNEISSV